jgi:hypothetical protein
MQPEQPAPLSVEPSPDVQAAPEASSESVTPASRNFLQRLFGGRGSQEAETQDQPEQAEASSAITLTKEELDRRVQAETDRREAKRTESAKAAEKRRLRDEDPWAYAEQERQAEHAQTLDTQTTNVLGLAGATHDRYTLDPLVEQLPEADRDRILKLEGAGVGLDGRKLIVSESLKALEKHWKAEGAADAESKLRRNPAFRKQVLGELRKGALPEPDFIGSGPPSAADRTVSDILRHQIRARH